MDLKSIARRAPTERLLYSFSFCLVGAILPNLTATSFRLSLIPRFRAASINRLNCSGSRSFGFPFFALALFSSDHPLCPQSYCWKVRPLHGKACPLSELASAASNCYSLIERDQTVLLLIPQREAHTPAAFAQGQPPQVAQFGRWAYQTEIKDEHCVMNVYWRKARTLFG